MKVGFVFGTRPEILKVYPLVVEAKKRKIDYFVVHTNQHYSHEMDQIFFEELDMDEPNYNLGIGSGSHNLQLAKMLSGIDEILNIEEPTHIIVQGDTNSTLAGALAACKTKAKVCHIEAGLRSYDKDMPEEQNRIITDNISDYLFPVTKIQEEILLSEGIDKDKVHTVGNTIVDTLKLRSLSAKDNKTILKQYNVKENGYLLLTMHRPSNVDDANHLNQQIDNLESFSKEKELKVVWPIHPRAKKNLEIFNITLSEKFILTEPLGYNDFLSLILNSKVIITDSGGIQEEACILKKPCITIRENTERPETVEVGANYLVGRDLNKIQEAYTSLLSFNFDYKNPFGDGRSSEQIFNILQK